MDITQQDYEEAKEAAMTLIEQAALAPSEVRLLLDAATEAPPEDDVMALALRALLPGRCLQAINWPKAARLLEQRLQARGAVATEAGILADGGEPRLEPPAD